MLLEHAGHEVHDAGDGPQGVDAALRLAPDVALIDMGLPGFDGYEVARRMRAQSRPRHAAGGADRLRPGRGPRAGAGGRLRPPSGQAGRLRPALRRARRHPSRSAGRVVEASGPAPPTAPRRGAWRGGRPGARSAGGTRRPGATISVSAGAGLHRGGQAPVAERAPRRRSARARSRTSRPCRSSPSPPPSPS